MIEILVKSFDFFVFAFDFLKTKTLFNFTNKKYVD
jgi:hypothetical protein